MKKWFLIFVATTLLIPASALGQSATTAPAEQARQPVAKAVTPKAVTLSGHVSVDRKFLISDKDEIWAVSNPDIFAGQEGKQVLAKCQLHADKNEIHVFFFKQALQEVKYISKGDSAFRR
jgi:hypothetical protein